MSKLGCACGHVIPDQTDNLPYKGHLLPDLYHDEFFDWMADQAASYVAAARSGQTEAWLMERGYGQDYVDLKLSDAEVLHDRIHTRFLSLKRDVYECGGCGRLHVETRENNRFMGYAPDNRKINAVLDRVQGDRDSNTYPPDRFAMLEAAWLDAYAASNDLGDVTDLEAARAKFLRNRTCAGLAEDDCKYAFQTALEVAQSTKRFLRSECPQHAPKLSRKYDLLHSLARRLEAEFPDADPVLMAAACAKLNLRWDP